MNPLAVMLKSMRNICDSCKSKRLHLSQHHGANWLGNLLFKPSADCIQGDCVEKYDSQIHDSNFQVFVEYLTTTSISIHEWIPDEAAVEICVGSMVDWYLLIFRFDFKFT